MYIKSSHCTPSEKKKRKKKEKKNRDQYAKKKSNFTVEKHGKYYPSQVLKAKWVWNTWEPSPLSKTVPSLQKTEAGGKREDSSRK